MPPYVNLFEGVATEATLAAVLDQLQAVLTELGQKLEPGQSINVGNLPAIQAVSGVVEVTNDTGDPLPVSGTVAVSNFPGPDESGLTDAQLRASAPAVKDDYQQFESLADQSGEGGVLTFTFTAAVQLVVVHAVGASLVARAATTQTPSAALGARCADDAPSYLPVTTSTVQVFTPVGMTVSVAGYRRT